MKVEPSLEKPYYVAKLKMKKLKLVST